ncbi:MAG TPA: N-acetyltransferase [Kiloniellales bacterium]|jgi:predicted N-acetyltransferase YhbS
MTGSSSGIKRTSRRRGLAPGNRPTTFVATLPSGLTLQGTAGARKTMTTHIVAERPQDAALLDSLLDRTFGSDRHKKTVYRLREGLPPVPGLAFSAIDEAGALLGSLRFWPVLIGPTRAIVLGPLAVEPVLQGLGIGRTLVRHGLDRARALGETICVVVGAPDYYQPYGFTNAGAAGLKLPGPVDAPRFQVLELVPGALASVTGLIGRADARAVGFSRGRSAAKRRTGR